MERLKILNPENEIHFIPIPLPPKLVSFQNSPSFHKINRGLEIVIFNDFLIHLNGHRVTPSLQNKGIYAGENGMIHNKLEWREKGSNALHLNDSVRIPFKSEISAFFKGEKVTYFNFSEKIIRSLKLQVVLTQPRFLIPTHRIYALIAGHFIKDWLDKHRNVKLQVKVCLQ